VVETAALQDTGTLDNIHHAPQSTDDTIAASLTRAQSHAYAAYGLYERCCHLLSCALRVLLGSAGRVTNDVLRRERTRAQTLCLRNGKSLERVDAVGQLVGQLVGCSSMCERSRIGAHTRSRTAAASSSNAQSCMALCNHVACAATPSTLFTECAAARSRASCALHAMRRAAGAERSPSRNDCYIWHVAWSRPTLVFKVHFRLFDSKTHPRHCAPSGIFRQLMILDGPGWGSASPLRPTFA
jgi:hypothetical protein